MSSITSTSPSLVYWLNNNLYLNITNKCSNDCYFCLRNFTRGVGGFNLKLESDPPPRKVILELQEVLNRRNWSEIVFCGFGEPLGRMDCILEVTKWIRRYYGKPVCIRIDTNGHGYLLNKGREVLKELEEAGLDKISVSLNAHNEETYNHVCRPKFKDAFRSVLSFVEKAKDNFEVEITAVTIPEVDLREMEKIARKLGVKFRRRKSLHFVW